MRQMISDAERIVECLGCVFYVECIRTIPEPEDNSDGSCKTKEIFKRARKGMGLPVSNKGCSILNTVCPYEFGCDVCRLYNDYEAAKEKAKRLPGTQEKR